MLPNLSLCKISDKPVWTGVDDHKKWIRWAESVKKGDWDVWFEACQRLYEYLFDNKIPSNPDCGGSLAKKKDVVECFVDGYLMKAAVASTDNGKPLKNEDYTIWHAFDPTHTAMERATQFRQTPGAKEIFQDLPARNPPLYICGENVDFSPFNDAHVNNPDRFTNEIFTKSSHYIVFYNTGSTTGLNTYYFVFVTIVEDDATAKLMHIPWKTCDGKSMYLHLICANRECEYERGGDYAWNKVVQFCDDHAVKTIFLCSLRPPMWFWYCKRSFDFIRRDSGRVVPLPNEFYALTMGRKHYPELGGEPLVPLSPFESADHQTAYRRAQIAKETQDALKGQLSSRRSRHSVVGDKRGR